MDFLAKDLTTELLSIVGVIGSACLVSYSFGNNDRSLFDRIFKRHNKIDNIYQLLPILQKNSKKLFLFFTDLATSLKAVSSPNDANVTKELVEDILSQEFYKNKVMELQKEVFDEFNVDSREVQKAISKFAEDDQVEFYALGVKRMFESVLLGNYPHCPGIEPNKEITEGKLLEILEKLAIAKTKNWFKHGNQLLSENEPLKDPEFEDIILKEMSKFGCDNILDAVVAIKNSENYFNYYPNFERARVEILSKVRRVYNSTDVQKVTGEELQLVMSTCEPETTVLVLVYDDLIHESSFNKLVLISTSKNPLKKLDELFHTNYNQCSTNGDLINKVVKECKKTNLDEVCDLDTNPSINDNMNGSVDVNQKNGELESKTTGDLNGSKNLDLNGSLSDPGKEDDNEWEYVEDEKELREDKGFNELKESKGVRESKESSEFRGVRDEEQLKEVKGVKELRDGKVKGGKSDDVKEGKDVKDNLKKASDISRGSEFNDLVDSLKVGQERLKSDGEMINHLHIENVVTLWVFKEEYKESKNIKQYPALVVYKGGRLDIVEKV